MDKKIHDQDAEEEYKLQSSQRESGAHFSEQNNSSETASAILEKTKRQHIFLVLILILASLGAYKVVNRLMQGASSRVKMATKLAKPALPTVPAAVQANNVIANRFTHLELQQRDLKSDFQAFDSELSDVKSTLAELNMRFAQINDQMQTLHMQQEAFLQKQQLRVLPGILFQPEQHHHFSECTLIPSEPVTLLVHREEYLKPQISEQHLNQAFL